jgi:hypothetical protein
VPQHKTGTGADATENREMRSARLDVRFELRWHITSNDGGVIPGIAPSRLF